MKVKYIKQPKNMKTKIIAILLLFVSITMFSQPKIELGTNFDYDKKEKDLKVVLVDNYNHFMFSVINIDGGMMPTNQIIIRKFDQKNQLVNTFIGEFPHKDIFTLHNYLRSFELGTDKLVVFAECYSGKMKKKELYKIVFDKKNSEFTTTLVSEFPFESLSKSGTVNILTSNNKNYIGILYSKYNNKKIPEEYECKVLDGKTLDVVWQKTIPFPLQSYTKDYVLSDKGKFVFVRKSNETGKKDLLSIIDGNTIENKDFGDDKIAESMMTSFSMGSNDYLLVFNYLDVAVRINSGYYDNILLYDLNAGKVLKNNVVNNFTSINDLQSVNFNNLSIQNNEIHLFVDCYFKTGTKPDPNSTIPNTPFKVPVYSNGNPSLLVFSMEGVLKNIVDYKVVQTTESLAKCIGIQNIKGNYYMNTSLKNGTAYYSGIYTLNSLGSTSYDQKIISLNDVYPQGSEHRNSGIINQFFNYLPDAKRLILAKSESEGKLVFFNVLNIEL